MITKVDEIRKRGIKAQICAKDYNGSAQHMVRIVKSYKYKGVWREGDIYAVADLSAVRFVATMADIRLAKLSNSMGLFR